MADRSPLLTRESKSYIESNIIGTFNILEIAKSLEVNHLLMASTSSVYGANERMPFNEIETDTFNRIQPRKLMNLWLIRMLIYGIYL